MIKNYPVTIAGSIVSIKKPEEVADNGLRPRNYTSILIESANARPDGTSIPVFTRVRAYGRRGEMFNDMITGDCVIIEGDYSRYRDSAYIRAGTVTQSVTGKWAYANVVFPSCILESAPVVETTQTGHPYSRFSVTTYVEYMNEDELVRAPSTLDCIAYGRVLEDLEPGAELMISGNLVNRSFISDDGNRRTTIMCRVNQVNQKTNQANGI